MIPELEERKKARKAAKEKRASKNEAIHDTILDLGKAVEDTEEGSPEEKELLKRRDRFIKSFNRSKK